MLLFARVHASNESLLQQVASDVFDRSIRADWLENCLHEPANMLLVAAENQVVVGQLLATIQQHVDAPPALYIDNLGVAPSHQRRGIARRLVQKATGIALAAGAREVWVVTEHENQAARAFYEDAGLTGRSAVVFEGQLPA